MTFHVIIIGGGLGGLCLAQALKKAGVSFTVYERDRTRTDRLQGYRIHIGPEGSAALHEALSPELWNSLIATSGKTGGGICIYDEEFNPMLDHRLQAEPGYEAKIDGHKSVSRITLRQVLLSGLEDHVKFGKRFERFEQKENGTVVAYFEDGTWASGNLLVGADGGNSRVRQQLLPHAQRIDTGVLGVAAKLPLTDETRAWLPKAMLQRVSIVTSKRGEMLFVASQQFNQAPTQADGEIGGNEREYKDLGFLFDNTKDYIFWAFTSRRENYSFHKHGHDIEGLGHEQLRAEVLEKIRDWNPDLVRLVKESDITTLSPLPIRTSLPVSTWKTSNVTLLGDAIHSMTPFKGIGANMALKDSQLLSHAIIAAHKEEKDLILAVAEYEKEMVGYGFKAVGESLQTMKLLLIENWWWASIRNLVFRVFGSVLYFTSYFVRGGILEHSNCNKVNKMVKNTTVTLKQYSSGNIGSENFAIENWEIDIDNLELKEGDFIIKNLRLSLDPFLSMRMLPASHGSGPAPFKLGEPLQGYGVAVVIKSKNPSFPEGEITYGFIGWQEYSVIREEDIKPALLRVIPGAKSSNIPLSYYIGILGMPGMTGYIGLHHVGKPKAGETIYISSAFGAVGQVVGQIAKIKGLRVVGSAGEDAKVEYLVKELGFDAAFNYKKVDHDEALSEYCPNGIDIYFDNVGGKILESTIGHMNPFGRIVACGMISQYSSKEPYGIKNLIQIIGKRLTFAGFTARDLGPQYASDFVKDVSQWIKEGRMRYAEQEVKGVENAPQALVDLLQGKSFGKAYANIAEL
ncbi:uncharacterized protein VTP21DRAFT_10795 [Calcarisporiella thermophila]|uniref:uncharacterized protein n=1 Tax=Calcarisporiella thermophila TaxID=911321 RepID=UPI00374303C6